MHVCAVDSARGGGGGGGMTIGCCCLKVVPPSANTMLRSAGVSPDALTTSDIALTYVLYVKPIYS